MAGEDTRTSKPGRKRLVLTISVLISFIIGLPICLKSTEVYRAHLPFDGIDSLAKSLKSEPVVLPCLFDIILLQLNFKSDDDSVVKQHLERIRGLISSEVQNSINKDGVDLVGCGNNYVVTVSLDSRVKCLTTGAIEGHWPCGLTDYLSSSIKDLSDDILVDELLHSYSPHDSDANGGRYTILVTGERNGDKHSHRTVIGKHRHAWIHGGFSDSVVPLIGEVVVKYFIGGGIAVSGRGQGFGTTDEKGEAMPLAADGTATLSFSLLNAEPADWIYDWDFEKLENRFLSPLVETLSPIATLAVESQVLYHTPKAAHSHWDQNSASYLLHLKDLPFFVCSYEQVQFPFYSSILHFACCFYFLAPYNSCAR